MESPHDHGRFSDDGMEYIVNTPHPPRDWYNYLWNRHTLASVSQNFTGNSLHQSDAGVVTNLFGRQDELRTPRAVYLRDHDTAEYWSAGYHPCCVDAEEYECRHGLGYSILTTKTRDIRTRFRVFVPREDNAEIWSLRISNESADPRALSIFTTCEIKLDGASFPYGYLSSLRGRYLEEDDFLFFQNTSYNVVREKYSAVMWATSKAAHWDLSRDSFLGRYRNPARPERVEEGRLGDSVASVEPLFGALQHDLQLAPGESADIHFVVGIVQDLDEARALKTRYAGEAEIGAELEAIRAAARERAQGLRLDTPDGDFNRLVNVWLKHQLHLMADWARFYFKGYRDTCQDAAGMSILDPRRALQMLKTALTHQRSDGYCPRAFRVPGREVGAADKRYADSASWISHATDAILRETGDLALLDHVVTFSDGGEGSLWEHNLRAMEFLWADRSGHGLSLIHDGDWCDLLDKVGPAGRGESVWMSFALARVLKLVSRMAMWRGETEIAETCCERFGELAGAIRRRGWDGGYFLVAINDAGEPIGTASAAEGKVFINPQSWAMLSGVIDADEYRRIAQRIEPIVDTPVGPVHCWPAFTRYQQGIGQLSGTPPGFFTNGNVYCHAAAFKVAADFEAGRNDKAFDTLMRILPHASRSEPYAQANGYVGPSALRRKHHVSDDPWRTGTVAWNFLNICDRLLGFERTLEGVFMRPRLPACWESARWERPFRGTLFDIEIRKGPEAQLHLDGVRQPGDFIAVGPGGLGKERVRVTCVQAR
jgi:cellobiose phosphorylase